ncbi:type II toxin-antitoxin system YhaV family toxin [Pseudomonas japonica]|uniref:type II toxin-antitoxin system YhaV family toxin n=1 Tax=Pseudomonas japonica TaxID=256466 RepID=UPI0015E4816A|nr:type II toxin-antitoxin system YhaV family toxin [Pseudomonas japonica]MBA1243785.1 type II toxin-antitoxin system YhaV family toxin [Pseudomonas japonica]
MAQEILNRVNGWALYAHPFFIRRLEALTSDVERAAVKEPQRFHQHPSYKLLDAVAENILIKVPADPTSPAYRQGNTLGRTNRHWFRVKKQGMAPRYRLFFQFRAYGPQAIIYAWLNDDSTPRKEGDKRDAYAAFASLLRSQKVASSFNDLLAQSTPYEACSQKLEAEDQLP